MRSEELFDSKEVKKSEEEEENRECRLDENRSIEAEDQISEKVNE